MTAFYDGLAVICIGLGLFFGLLLVLSILVEALSGRLRMDEWL
jgi:hypothetical protein